jgi:hypothetical protein
LSDQINAGGVDAIILKPRRPRLRCLVTTFVKLANEATVTAQFASVVSLLRLKMEDTVLLTPTRLARGAEPNQKIKSSPCNTGWKITWKITSVIGIYVQLGIQQFTITTTSILPWENVPAAPSARCRIWWYQS